MITVTHTCGHTQATFMDERHSEKDIIFYLGKSKQQFLEEQVAWLSGNHCPECYRRAKGLQQ